MRLFAIFRGVLRDALDADGKKIVNLGMPTQNGDAANKAYVDSATEAVLDDTVTQSSANGVKSSGIWSFVKGLIGNLTGTVAEALAGKASSVNGISPDEGGSVELTGADIPYIGEVSVSGKLSNLTIAVGDAESAAGDAYQAAESAQATADSKIDSEEATSIAVAEVEQGIDRYDSTVVHPALEVKLDADKVFDGDEISNDFATNLLGKPVAKEAIDERLPIPISAKSAGFTTESYKRFVVTVSGDMTVTLHTPTSGDAEIFECRFNGTSLSADASITFAGATATTMDANCGTVKAGKVALMSAFWNGTTWDVNWKVEG